MGASDMSPCSLWTSIPLRLESSLPIDDPNPKEYMADIRRPIDIHKNNEKRRALSWTLANFFRKDAPILSAFPMLVGFSHCPDLATKVKKLEKGPIFLAFSESRFSKIGQSQAKMIFPIAAVIWYFILKEV